MLEGRDTSGKGGVIDAIAAHINPRHARGRRCRRRTSASARNGISSLCAASPAAGEIRLFDRSWYNRAGVEKVMGFASDAQVKAFLKQAPAFERQLVDDGILLFKYWLCVDQEQQEERFAERLLDPLKRWKLSPIDLEARQHYHDYTRAREAMLKATHTAHAPWTLVDFNDQNAAA